MSDVNADELRELAEVYRLDEYVPVDHADLIALLDRLAVAEAAVERVRRAQRDRAEAVRWYRPARNAALEAHIDSIDNALGGEHVLSADTARDEPPAEEVPC